MAKSWVVFMIHEDDLAASNAFLSTIYGEDPQLAPNAYLSGEDEEVPTRNVSRDSFFAPQVADIVTFFGSFPNSGVYTELVQQGVQGPNCWLKAEELWNVLPFVGVPG